MVVTPLILSTGQRPVDLCEFETSVVCIVSPRTARASQGNPVLKRTITKIKNKRKRRGKRRLEADVSLNVALPRAMGTVRTTFFRRLL